ncbi:MAG: methyltransferase domain-containing protein [Alphaproteobacteria bacterium]
MVIVGIVALLLLLAIIYTEIYTAKARVVPAPSRPIMRTTMLEQLPLDLTGVIYDLGSGWGGLALRAARRCEQANVVGIELSPLPYWCSRLFIKHPRVSFRRGNFLEQPLAEASALICYLNFDIMREIGEKLITTLPKGCLIISATFPIPNLEPILVVHTKGLMVEAPVYVYKKG